MSQPDTTRPETASGLTLALDRTYAATPERVFRAWTDPTEMSAWFAPDPAMPVKAEVDLKVAGRYRIAMSEYVVTGEYREIDPPNKLVFTWKWEEWEGAEQADMLVTVELRPEGNGTHLSLRHEHLADAEARASHADGWEKILPRLEQYLAAA